MKEHDTERVSEVPSATRWVSGKVVNSQAWVGGFYIRFILSFCIKNEFWKSETLIIDLRILVFWDSKDLTFVVKQKKKRRERESRNYEGRKLNI